MCFEFNEMNKRNGFLFEKFETMFEWTIDRLNQRTDTSGRFIKSKLFGDINDPKTKWSLYLYPNGVDKKSKDFVGIFLELETTRIPEVSAKYKISIRNGNQWKPIDDFIEYRFRAGMSFGSKKFISKSNISRGSRLSKEELIIKCELIYENICRLVPKKSFQNNRNLLIDSSESLLQMSENCLVESQTNEEFNEEVLQILHNLVAEKVRELKDQLSVAIGKYKNNELETIYERIVSLIK